jgi:hypothetical protein
MISLTVNKGSDLTSLITINDEDGDPINLTGRSIVFFDVASGLQSRLTGQRTDAVNGEFEIKVEGSAPIETGEYKFRLQLNTTGGDSLALPIFDLNVI